MKKDLSKSTFIIPIRIESEDRMRNIITSILFLLENFDTTIIVKEVDTTSVFEKDVFECIIVNIRITLISHKISIQ